MYIKKEDHIYFMDLFNRLDKAGQRKFLGNLQKADAERSGDHVSKINIFDDSIYSIYVNVVLKVTTRAMIRKAYESAK